MLPAKVTSNRDAYWKSVYNLLMIKEWLFDNGERDEGIWLVMQKKLTPPPSTHEKN